MADDKKSDTVGPSDTLNAPDQHHVPTETQKRSIGGWLLAHVWDTDTHLRSPEEKRLVRKLDLGILICATLGWWMKYIDQSNVTNAYVSGMREDLNMYGNEYNYMLMCYTISYAIMQVPSNIIALKVSPRICILICELGWTAFTFAQAGAQSANQMYAFRFMIGFFEAGFAPIIIFLIGTWYTKAELAKRITIWHMVAPFGLATSGFLQAAINRTLDGRLGLPGWRWMYIICGCMSLPVAVSVWFLLPDYPHTTTIWYLTEEDKQMAIQRGAKQKKAAITGVLDVKLFKRMFGSWRFWILCLTYVVYGNSCQSYNYFAIYLREQGYSVTMRNTIPALANICTMVCEFTYGVISDATGNRKWVMVVPIMCTTVVGSSILTAWPESNEARVAAFFLIACGFVTAIIWTWASEINIGNAEERALTISSMAAMFYATNAALPIALFPQTMAPRFERGFPALLGFALTAVFLILLGDYLHNRQLRKEEGKASSEPQVEIMMVDGKENVSDKEADLRS